MKTRSNSNSSKFHQWRRLAVWTLATMAWVPQAFAATTYTMIDLGQDIVGATPASTFIGGLSSGGAYALNNNGQVLGVAVSVQNTLIGTTLYGYRQVNSLIYNSADATWADVSTLADGTPFWVKNVFTSSGQAVGYLTNNTGQLPDFTVPQDQIIRNADGTVVTVQATTDFTPGYGFGSGYDITAINDAGPLATVLAGPYQWFYTSTYTLYGASRSGYIGNIRNGNVTSANLKPVGSLKAPTELVDDTIIADINAAGTAVGYSKITFDGQYHAFVTTPAGLKDLHIAALPTGHSKALKINDSGYAVGYYHAGDGAANGLQTAKILHATVWNAATGKYTDMGSATNPKTSSFFHAINAGGQVLGYEQTYNGIILLVPPRNRPGPEGVVAGSQHHLVGDIHGGGFADLNTLITNKPAGWNVTSTTSINNAGQILASVTDPTGRGRAVLLMPASPPPAPPAAPSGLTATAKASTQIALSWADNATNETAQYVERCADAACTSFAQVASLGADATAFADSGVVAGTRYSYRVRAHGAAGDSAYSNVASATTPSVVSGGAPAAPTGLQAGVVTRNQVMLTWIDNASNESSFEIERCRGQRCSNFAAVGTSPANAAAFTNTNLHSNTDYSYRVRATNPYGVSGYSNVVAVKTLR
jgi:probable HAF family extracellular repeat protein